MARSCAEQERMALSWPDSTSISVVLCSCPADPLCPVRLLNCPSGGLAAMAIAEATNYVWTLKGLACQAAF